MPPVEARRDGTGPAFYGMNVRQVFHSYRGAAGGEGDACARIYISKIRCNFFEETHLVKRLARALANRRQGVFGDDDRQPADVF